MPGKFSKELSREWFAHALREFGEPVPEDAVLVGLDYNAERDIYTLVFESDEGKVVPEGGMVYQLSELDHDGE